MKTQELGFAFVLVTICVSFFTVVVLAALGRPVPVELQTVVITVFTALAAGVPSWLAASRLGDAKQQAEQANLRAENSRLTLTMLRNGLDVPK